VIPVDVTVKGCPPPPLEILKGLLGIFEVMDAKSSSPGADPA
jgi:Ni,Fe-hydrogenase III small subunit